MGCLKEINNTQDLPLTFPNQRHFSHISLTPSSMEISQVVGYYCYQALQKGKEAEPCMLGNFGDTGGIELHTGKNEHAQELKRWFSC